MCITFARMRNDYIYTHIMEITLIHSESRKCNRISLFKLRAFPFNMILIVCAININSTFYHCDLLCTQLRVFI